MVLQVANIPEYLTNFLGTCTTDEEALQKLKGEPTHYLDFFQKTLADVTWSKKHESIIAKMVSDLDTLVNRKILTCQQVATLQKVAASANETLQLVPIKLLTDKDLTFKLKDGKEVRVNHLLLYSCERVLLKLFEKGTKETELKTAFISEIDKETFDKILEFLENGNISELKEGEISNLLHVCDHYQIEQLTAYLVESRMNQNNFHEFFQFAYSHSSHQVMKLCRNWFNTKIKGVTVLSDNFQELEIVVEKYENFKILKPLLDYTKDKKVKISLELRNLDKQTMEELIPLCPNLSRLSIKNNTIKELPELPDGLEILECNWCEKLSKLPKLPHRLKKLVCSDCKELSELSELPDGLEILDCPRCEKLSKLPKLPHRLKTLVCSDCKELSELPELPDGLEELVCARCEKLSKLPKLPHRLLRLNCVTCEKLSELPELPHRLKTLVCTGCGVSKLPKLPDGLLRLNCKGCGELSELPELPDGLEILECNWCEKLSKLPKLPDGLKKLVCSDCKELSELPELPDGLKILDCRRCKELSKFPKFPDGLKELYLRGCKEYGEIKLPDRLIKYDGYHAKVPS